MLYVNKTIYYYLKTSIEDKYRKLTFFLSIYSLFDAKPKTETSPMTHFGIKRAMMEKGIFWQQRDLH